LTGLYFIAEIDDRVGDYYIKKIKFVVNNDDAFSLEINRKEAQKITMSSLIICFIIFLSLSVWGVI
jgi:hypothetical protein